MLKYLVQFTLLLIVLPACAEKKTEEATESVQHQVDLSSPYVQTASGEGYEIEIQFNKGLKENTKVLLTFAMGAKDNFYSRDTAYTDSRGRAVFSNSNTELERGFYMVYIPDMGNFFEIIVADEKRFKVEVNDPENFYNKMKVTGSEQNKTFVEYNNYLNEHAQSNPEKVMEYRNAFLKNNPNHLLAKVLLMMKEVEVPDAPAELSEEDKKVWQYNYYKAHYWDHFSFNEPGIIRTPGGLLHSIIERYFDKVLSQDPDTLIVYTDMLIESAFAMQNKPLAKYFIQHFSRKYETSKVMCHDGVFGHLGVKYYCPDRYGNSVVDWLDSATKMKICEKAYKISATSCKRQVPDLRTADINGKYHHLFQLSSNYTIVLFWDPTCGHCKKVIPKINDLTLRYKDTLSVYAIGTEAKYDEWEKYINQHPEISHWVNVSKTDKNMPWINNRALYNIQSNPVIFLLDKDKKVLAKKIDENKLEEFLLYSMGEQGLISKEQAQSRIAHLQKMNAASEENADAAIPNMD